jgi:hypothetical protein
MFYLMTLTIGGFMTLKRCFAILLSISFLAVIIPQAVEAESSLSKDYTSQGSVRVGVSTGLNYNAILVEGFNLSTLTLGLNADYFIVNRLTIGPSLSVAQTFGDGDDTTLLTFGVGIGAAFTVNERFIPSFKIVPGFGLWDLGVGDSLKKFNLGFALGFDYLIVDHVALGVGFGIDLLFAEVTIKTINVPLRFTLYF